MGVKVRLPDIYGTIIKKNESSFSSSFSIPSRRDVNY